MTERPTNLELRPEEIKVRGEHGKTDKEKFPLLKKAPPTHHFTTEIEKNSRESDVVEGLLDQPVNLTLREVLAVAPPVRQMINSMTRVKREPITHLDSTETHKTAAVRTANCFDDLEDMSDEGSPYWAL